MTTLDTVETLANEIRDIYLGNAQRPYGLYGINQLQRALQSAAHAEAQALPSSLVMACLLHDVGHMIHDLGEAPAEEGVDDLHEALGADWTAARFPRTVSEPIRLHVAAKRYLCSVEP
ncbi:MAG: metal-dependent phosphohydrolase, partial [Caulobacter sp.]|nr:metal-dependent phosphohydrolase [Caulobacter sp.]